MDLPSGGAGREAGRVVVPLPDHDAAPIRAAFLSLPDFTYSDRSVEDGFTPAANVAGIQYAMLDTGRRLIATVHGRPEKLR
jgi:hypothetical protein